MTKQFNQPDLFLVMNDEEMNSALSYAEELIGENEKTVEMYLNFSLDNDLGQYKLSINNIDTKEFILDKNNNFRFEFPMIPYYCLIFFVNGGKRDCLALALPISVWPEAHDLEYIKSFFIKHNFKINDYIPKFFLNEEFISTIKPEAKQAESKKIDSPWTIRDKETLKGTLLPGGGSSAINDIKEVNNILLIKNSNITLDFNATVITSSRFDTAKIDYSTFKFPNSLIVHTKDDKKTPIYIGEEVNDEEIINILKYYGLLSLTVIKDAENFLENMEELVMELMPFARFKENKTTQALKI